MIIPISIRDGHPDDMRIKKWYEGIIKQERSRKIREILLSYIEGGQHTIKVDSKQPITTFNEPIKMVNVVNDVEEDLDSKMDNLGGLF